MCLGRIIFVFILLGVYWHFWTLILSVVEISQPLLLHNIPSTPVTVSFFSGIPIMIMSNNLIFSFRSQTLCALLSLFPSCVGVEIFFYQSVLIDTFFAVPSFLLSTSMVYSNHFNFYNCCYVSASITHHIIQFVYLSHQTLQHF